MQPPLATLPERQPGTDAGVIRATRLARRHALLLAILAGELILIYAPTVLWLYERWTMSIWHNGHGMLIPFVVAFFAREELKRLPARGEESSAWGFLFVVPAILLHSLDMGIHTQLLSAASLVLMLPGLSLLLLGRARTAAIALPLAFLTLMLPVPLALTEPLHMLLRQIATTASAGVVTLLGVTTYTEDTTIHLANASLLVGDACSGFSTLYAALAVAILTAYSSRGPWRRALVVASAAPIAVAANIIRVILLVLIVNATGVDVLATWVHPASGMLTFALALPVILWIGSPPAADGSRR